MTDTDYREFARELIEQNIADVDWSIDKDQLPKRMTDKEETIITIPVPPGMENLLDPKVIARRVANGERLNREMAAKYPDHPNWSIYKETK